MKMMMGIGLSNRATIVHPIATNAIKLGADNYQKQKPPILISTNPSSINLDSLSTLYRRCHHSPHRISAGFDAGKLTVVVSVFAEIDSGEEEEGFIRKFFPVAGRITAENGELVGFGRAVSDLIFTASIYDVMVIPSLRRRGIGRMIVQRIVRMLTSRGIYDISSLCSDKERLFFEACGFGDDALGSTTMVYAKMGSTTLDDHQIIT